MAKRIDDVWIFFAIGAVFGLLAGAIAFAMLAGDSRSDWVAWAQALGGVLAGLIGAAVALVIVRHSVAPVWHQVDLQSIAWLNQAAKEFEDEREHSGNRIAAIMSAIDGIIEAISEADEMNSDIAAYIRDRQITSGRYRDGYIVGQFVDLLNHINQLAQEEVGRIGVLIEASNATRTTREARSKYITAILDLFFITAFPTPASDEWITTAEGSKIAGEITRNIVHASALVEAAYLAYSASIVNEQRHIRAKINSIYNKSLTER